MTLELASGRVVHDATSDDVLTLLDGEEFAILSTDPETYMHCGEQKGPPCEYELEHRDGSPDAPDRAVDGPVTLDRVISAFIWYLENDPSWRSRFRWERIELP